MNKISPKPSQIVTPHNDLTLYQTGLERNRTEYKRGKIVSVLQDKNNVIHAVIQEDPYYLLDQSFAETAFFNNYFGGNLDLTELPLAPLLIPITNAIITPTETLENFKGRDVIVRLIEGIAVSAELTAETFLDFFKHKAIRRVLEQNEKFEKDVVERGLEEFADVTFESLGLITLIKDVELPPVLVIADHATTDQATRSLKRGRAIIPENDLFKGNQLLSKLKTALCHTPAKFLSGK